MHGKEFGSQQFNCSFNFEESALQRLQWICIHASFTLIVGLHG